MPAHDAVIVDAVRTPVGKRNGSLAGIHAVNLSAHVLNALVEDNIIYNNGTGGGSGINCDGVDDSIFRNNLLYANVASGISNSAGTCCA